MNDLEKIDILRQRMQVGYGEAKAALEANNGDLVEALVYLEEQERIREYRSKRGIVGQLRNIVEKGSQTHIKVKKGESTLFEFPATLGALGLAGALASTQVAVVGMLGAATLMAKKYSLEVDREEEENEDVPQEQSVEASVENKEGY